MLACLRDSFISIYHRTFPLRLINLSRDGRRKLNYYISRKERLRIRGIIHKPPEEDRASRATNCSPRKIAGTPL